MTGVPVLQETADTFFVCTKIESKNIAFFLYEVNVTQGFEPATFSHHITVKLLTRSSAVTAQVISAHLLHFYHDSLGQLPYDVVLVLILVIFEGVVQCLLFTVLEYRHPAEKYTGNNE